MSLKSFGSGTQGEVNTGSNVGGEAEVFKAKSVFDFVFRTIKAGAGIIVTQNANDIEIEASGGGNTIKRATVSKDAASVVVVGPGAGIVNFVEVSDPDGLFDNATKRFKIPTGTVGTVNGLLTVALIVDNKGYMSIRKNGGAIEKGGQWQESGHPAVTSFPVQGVADDYWEVYFVTGESASISNLALPEFNYGAFDLYI